MINLFRLLSLKYLKKHWLRWVMTIGGISLGVAAIVSINLADKALVDSFRVTVDKIAGKTQLQITAGDVGVSEDVLERVRKLPSIASASPVIEQTINVSIHGKGLSLLVLGVDLLADANIREYNDNVSDQHNKGSLQDLLLEPNAVLITKTLANQYSLTINDKISIKTSRGYESFVVKAISDNDRISSIFGGAIAIMDIYTAQNIFGRVNHFDKIDLILKPNLQVQTSASDIRQSLGSGYEVTPPEMRVQKFDALMSVYTTLMNLIGLFSIVIGVYIIYNTFSISVTQRRSEIGTLRTLGATKRQIRTVFVSESIFAGSVASLIGMFLGIGLAYVSLGSVSSFIGNLYGIAIGTSSIKIEPSLIAFSFIVGVTSSVVGALLPAHSASSIDPVQAMNNGSYEANAPEALWYNKWAFLFLFSTATIFVFLLKSQILFYVGYLLYIISVIVITPKLIFALAEGIRTIVRRLWLIDYVISSDSIIRAKRRTFITVTALMLSFVLVVAISGVSTSSYLSIRNWLDNVINPDLFMTPSENIAARNLHFPLSLEKEILSIQGVADVQSISMPEIRLSNGATPMLTATNLKSFFSHVKPRIIEGNIHDMASLSAAGKGVVISESLSSMKHIHLGQDVEIFSPSGSLKMPIVGVIENYTSQNGSVLMDRAVFTKYWKNEEVHVFRIYTTSQDVIPRVEQSIRDKFGGKMQFVLMRNKELRAHIIDVADQWFRMTYFQVVIAVIVAVIGLFNSLFASITDRRRELAVFRANGAVKKRIRSFIVAESIFITLIGFIAGIIVGAANLYFIIKIAGMGILGVTLTYHFPWDTTIILAVFVLLSAWAVAVWAAAIANKGNLVKSLGYE